MKPLDATQTMELKTTPPPKGADDRPRFRSATLAKGCQVRLQRQYIDGTLTPERREQVRDGVLQLVDAVRFLEVRVMYADGSLHVVWVPWAQVAQVEPL